MTKEVSKGHGVILFGGQTAKLFILFILFGLYYLIIRNERASAESPESWLQEADYAGENINRQSSLMGSR